jgi:uncharacterized protein
MIFNVAQLLKSPIGATQDVVLDDSDSLDLRDGEARLRRTNHWACAAAPHQRVIVVDGVAHIPLVLECSRCLTEFTTTLDVPLRETFYPSIDIETGLPVRLPEDETASRLTTIQIDLREAIRQNGAGAADPATLPRGLQGLCPECGRDLNVEPHTHATEARGRALRRARQLLEAD